MMMEERICKLPCISGNVFFAFYHLAKYLVFRLISHQAACRVDSRDFREMRLAWLPALLHENLA